FDNLQTSQVAPQLFPVGTYNGIAYGGVVVLDPLAVASVVPHSRPNQIGAAGPIDLLQLGSITLNTYATLKRGTGTTSFDLKSFWWGLGTDTGSTAGLAQGGTISVTGTYVNGSEVPVASYSFAPEGTLNQPLIFATLPNTFTDLAEVDIGVATSEPLTERTYIALDDVTHVNHS
ncbi:hypothetical protein EV356DRAFT_476343, partial [Viridothelium virens]